VVSLIVGGAKIWKHLAKAIENIPVLFSAFPHLLMKAIPAGFPMLHEHSAGVVRVAAMCLCPRSPRIVHLATISADEGGHLVPLAFAFLRGTWEGIDIVLLGLRWRRLEIDVASPHMGDPNRRWLIAMHFFMVARSFTILYASSIRASLPCFEVN